MRNIWENYGQTIIIDSTYKIIKNNRSLFSIIAINGEGMSEALCYFLVQDERVIIINSIFDYLFKKNNFEILETIIVD